MNAPLKQIIEEKVFSRFKDAGEPRWIFDFRKVSMTKEFMDLYTKVFFEHFHGMKELQVCGLESSSIPLVTALAYAGEKYGVKVNGLFIRKSRKKHDLYKALEGTPTKAPVIIIDDIINSGKSALKQIEILSDEGLKVEAIFCLIRYRDESFYDFLRGSGVRFLSLFERNDFKDTLGALNLDNKKEFKPLPFTYKWGFKVPLDTVNFRNIVPKSAPVIYKDAVLFGTDSGTFYCINKKTGEAIWKHQVLFGDHGKKIYSSPALHHDTVYFGAYDGNFYALDAATGKKKWTYMEADWIGSSPSVSAKHGYVYVGLEFGLWKKHGGIAALDAQSGEEIWRDTHEGLTHCSPYVSEKNNLLFCGSNDGILRIYNAKTGERLKEHTIGSPMRASFSENAAGTKISFGAFDKKCYIIDSKTLEISDSFETLEAIYSTPLWMGETIVISSLDKNVYAYDTATKKVLWKFLTNGRVFCNPTLIQGAIFVGSNDGVLYKLDAAGTLMRYIQFKERIVNRPIFDAESGFMYVPTVANELHCIQL